MKTFLKNFINDESGASAAEYALIIAVVGVGIGAAALSLGANVEAAIGNASNETKSSIAPGWRHSRHTRHVSRKLSPVPKPSSPMVNLPPSFQRSGSPLPPMNTWPHSARPSARE